MNKDRGRKLRGGDGDEDNLPEGGFNLSHRLLSQEEEARLCQQAQEGNQKAIDEVVGCNLRLVISIAKKYRGRSMTFEDLVQEGVIGLMEAIQRFDSTRECRFSTYATYWVRQSINRSMAKQDRTVRLPIYGGNAERKIDEASQRLEYELGRRPTLAEVSSDTGLSKTLIDGISVFGVDPLSLDLIMGEEGDLSFGDAIPDPNAIDPEAWVVETESREEIGKWIELLPERERFVIEHRFGLSEGRVWSLREIAHLLRLSREGVRNIESKGLKRLRKLMLESPDVQIRMWGEIRYGTEGDRSVDG